MRTAWLDSGIENYPRAVANAYLYQQETGFKDDGSPMPNVFIVNVTRNCFGQMSVMSTF